MMQLLSTPKHLHTEPCAACRRVARLCDANDEAWALVTLAAADIDVAETTGHVQAMAAASRFLSVSMLWLPLL
jgi:hypothetical protein